MRNLTLCSIGGAFALVGVGIASATAGPDFPYAESPYQLPGMETGMVQPRETVSLRIGTRQPVDSSAQATSTGLQNYDGGATYRGKGRLSFGFSVSIFDDVTERPVFGSTQNLTFAGAELEAKYALVEGPNLFAAISGAVGQYRFDQQGGPAEDLTAATLSLPVTYRFDTGLALTGSLGYTHMPDEIGTAKGYGGRGFLSLGAGYAINDRLYVYGNAKQLFRAEDQGPEGTNADTLYAAGVRYALTPQTTASLYFSTSQGNTPITDDLRYVASGDDAIIGAEFTITPSRKRFNIPRYGTRLAAADGVAQFREGLTMPGAQTIGSNSVRFSAYGTNEESGGVAVAISPDPDIQFDVIVENFALTSQNALINETTEDLRAMVGLRWQALSQDEGAPLSLGFNTLFSRDLDKPTIGVLYAGITAERAVSDTVRLRGNIRSAAFTDNTLSALGTGIDMDFGNNFVGMAEYSVVSEGDDIWAIGARRQLRNDAPAAWEIYATNSAGRYGVGTVIAGETQFGIGLSWQTPSSLF